MAAVDDPAGVWLAFIELKLKLEFLLCLSLMAQTSILKEILAVIAPEYSYDARALFVNLLEKKCPAIRLVCCPLGLRYPRLDVCSRL